MRYSSKQSPQVVNVFDRVTGISTTFPPIAISPPQVTHVHGRFDDVGVTLFFTACSIAATSCVSSPVFVSARSRGAEAGGPAVSSRGCGATSGSPLRADSL
jgi:hypothetical protein